MILHNPFGPIFEKELRATSRRKRTYWLRTAYLGGLLMFLVLAYASTSDFGAGAGVVGRVQAQNELGQVFFVCFSLFCVGSMAMIGPVLTSTAISAERLHKTLHVLLMTPITSWQIITGKLFSRLLVAITLIGLSLPVLALVRLLGGAELWQMFGIVALAAATAVATAAMGLFVSTFVNRAYAAILLAYAMILFAYVLVPVLALVSASGGGGPPPWRAVQFATTVSPFFSTAFMYAPMGPVFRVPWGWCVLVQLGLAAAMVASCAAMLRRIQRREGSAGPACEPAPAALPPLLATPAEEVAPVDPTAAPEAPPEKPKARKKRRRRSDVGDNPVLWRELGRPLFATRWQSRAAFFVLIALALVTYWSFHRADLLDDEELQAVYACAFNGAACLVLAVISATAIAQEKESDTWTLLLATPINGRAVVVGKVLGLYRRMLWPALGAAAHFLIFVVCDVISLAAMLTALWVIFAFNTVWVATGVLLSLRMRRVTFAVIANLGLVLGAYVVVPVLLLIVGEFSGANDDLAEMYAWTIPYFYLAEGVTRFSPDFRPDSSYHSSTFGDIGLDGLLATALVVGAAHVLLAGCIVGLTLSRFNRIVGRAEQVEALPGPEVSVKTSPTMG